MLHQHFTIYHEKSRLGVRCCHPVSSPDVSQTQLTSSTLSVSGGATTTSTASPAQNSHDQPHDESETECLLEEEEEEEEEEVEDGVVRGDKTSQDDSGICDGPGSLEVLSCRTGPSITSLPEASCPSPASPAPPESRS